MYTYAQRYYLLKVKKKEMEMYWFLLDFSKAYKEVAIDVVPNKFVTFEFFPQFLFPNFKFETDVHD